MSPLEHVGELFLDRDIQKRCKLDLVKNVGVFFKLLCCWTLTSLVREHISPLLEGIHLNNRSVLPKQDAIDRVNLGRWQWNQTTDGYFSHSSGSWKFKLKVLICLVSGEGPLLLAYGWHPLIVFQRRVIPDVFLFQIQQFYQIRTNPMTLFKCIYYQEGTILYTVVPRYQPKGIGSRFPLRS